MATREARKGGSFGWFIIGILVGAAVVVGAYVYMTRDGDPLPPEPVTAALPERSADAPAATSAPPPVAAPAPPPTAPATPAPAATPSEDDRQIADDAAATGMTGVYAPPDEQPTN